MGRDHRASFVIPLPIHFNPRAPVGRDFQQKLFWLDEIISIPAPLWGATYLRGMYGVDQSISIPAPLWGATSAPVG